MPGIQDRIVANLRRFNAKERDHLMRFAYLGALRPYDQTESWLSEPCRAALEAIAYPESGRTGRCVFAAMDYHLDWLCAALTLAVKEPDWDARFPSGPEVRDPSDGRLTRLQCRLVEGTPEDVDLLVVFQEERELRLLFVEAKSTPRFKPSQLGRKLVRLEAILRTIPAGIVRAKVVLAAPGRPELGWHENTAAPYTCREFAARVGTAPDQLSEMERLLVQDPRGLGAEWTFLELPGFPTSLASVRRVDETLRPAVNGSQWQAVPRPAGRTTQTTSGDDLPSHEKDLSS